MPTPRRSAVRRRRLKAFLASTFVLLVLAGGAVFAWQRIQTTQPGCAVKASAGTYLLDPEQAANAATVAATAERLQLPHHAVTVALAAALQESKLHNLDYGDRDSVGVFQQRPSQGWGSQAQLMDPAYAAQAFLEGLAKVRGWQTMTVADAAQSVQHSASRDAYAGWEEQARVIARALTGEAPAALTCTFSEPEATVDAAGVRASMQAQFGPALTRASARWTVTSWLVAHAYRSGIRSVSYDGHTWTSASGSWKDGGSSGSAVTARLADSTTVSV